MKAFAIRCAANVYSFFLLLGCSSINVFINRDHKHLGMLEHGRLAILKVEKTVDFKPSTMAANEDKVFRVNNRLCRFSNNGAYVAVAFQTNLLIKNAKTFGTCQSFVFADVIQVRLYSCRVILTNCKKKEKKTYYLKECH